MNTIPHPLFAGITDEAGSQLSQQLKAQDALGWTHMELRNVNGQHVCDLEDTEWQQIRDQIGEAGQHILGFCGRVGDGKHRIDQAFERDVEELQLAAPRMQACGARLFRCMSFPNSKETPWEHPDWRREVIRRLKELSNIADDHGILLAHENCSGYGAASPERCMDVMAEVNHPAFGLILDTGNPSHHIDGRSAWEWYQVMKEAIVHVHVKDYRQAPGQAGVMCFPGEGESGLDLILNDLALRKYQGAFSIEPHITHSCTPGSAEAEQAAYRIYLEHGQKTVALWNKSSAADR